MKIKRSLECFLGLCKHYEFDVGDVETITSRPVEGIEEFFDRLLESEKLNVTSEVAMFLDGDSKPSSLTQVRVEHLTSKVKEIQHSEYSRFKIIFF